MIEKGIYLLKLRNYKIFVFIFFLISLFLFTILVKLKSLQTDKNTKRIYYDIARKIIITTDSDKNIKEYNALTGSLIKEILSQGHIKKYNDQNMIIDEILPNKTRLIYEYDATTNHLVKQRILSANEIEYNLISDKIRKITFSDGTIREYSSDDSDDLILKETLPDGTIKLYNQKEHTLNIIWPQGYTIKYDLKTGFLLEKTGLSGNIEQYITCLDKEILPNGITRKYSSDIIQETALDNKIKKEYDLNTKKLKKIIFPDGYIQEYSLYFNFLQKEIFPDGTTKEYDNYQTFLIKETLSDRTIKKYDIHDKILFQQINPDGSVQNTLQKFDSVTGQLEESILPDNTIVKFNPVKKEIMKMIWPDGSAKETIFERDPQTQKIIKIIFPNNHIQEFHLITNNLIRESWSDGKFKEYDPINSWIIKE
ncbi:hypothetical protein, partial [Candidatus Phytoplasma melaleucae]|uniref:hypothetical protein n=1 Tax=Candidatus Phytoplasma melaleucae TaxID=2982630 RepID=UPI00271557DD